ncbi:MAG: hypothetical protein ACRESO_03530 [Gammaproteobacteria bacterium]
MFLRKKKATLRSNGPSRLPSYVRNVNSAQCLFCPYGTDLKEGDRVIAWDEKTVFDREQRERLVEITAIKAFRTNGRVVTLDFVVASDEDLARIAEDSEIAPQALLTHRLGKSTFDTKKPPVVVYFRTYEKKDDVLQLVPDLDVTLTGAAPLRRSRYVSTWDRLKSWLRGWMWRNS